MDLGGDSEGAAPVRFPSGRCRVWARLPCTNLHKGLWKPAGALRRLKMGGELSTGGSVEGSTHLRADWDRWQAQLQRGVTSATTV